MKTTLNKFMDSYNDYVKKDPRLKNTLIGYFETEDGEYWLYHTKRITTNANTRMFIASNIFQGKVVDQFSSKASAKIHIEINLEQSSEDILVADIYIVLPGELVEWDSSMADSLINQGFKIDNSRGEPKDKIVYGKRFKEVKDFGYYFKFTDKLSQGILKYISLANKEKQKEGE